MLTWRSARGRPAVPSISGKAAAIDTVLGIHEDDPTLGYRFLTDELADVGLVASENRVWRLCSIAGVFASHSRKRSKAGKPGPPVHGDLLAVVDGMARAGSGTSSSRPPRIRCG